MRRRLAVCALGLCLIAHAATAADPPHWPRAVTDAGDELRIFQPQLTSWADRVHFDGRVAIIVTPKGRAATSGVLDIEAETRLDAANGSVSLRKLQVTGTQFPGVPAADAAGAAAVATRLPAQTTLDLPLSYLAAALVHSGQRATSVPLDTTPPPIHLAEQPARLLLFDGAPTFATVAGGTVQHAVNTNWPLLRDGAAGAYYLLDDTGWLTSAALAAGPWQYTEALPASFSTLPDDAAWRDVKAHIPAPRVDGQPPLQVYVSSVPAELIVIVGAPQYARIPNTGLYVVQNTDSQLVWDGYAKAYYYLTGGRWFRAAKLAGPWTYATGSLPADFASIPPDGPMAAVLASVPGTAEAQEASLEAQIPHLATVSRTAVTASTTYDGAPQFAAIEGTALSYALNTPDDVIRVGERYYLCKNGVWFVANSPTGPWSVTPAVPEPIYAIPPSAPVYHVTYVRPYEVTDDSVVFGYTDGYLGEYVTDGVVTWGTGYYYPPYLTAGPTPYYYPRPYTYGCDAFYNPLTGTFHRGGYGYGPYGGLGAGAVYVPSTGAYVRGAAAYGPVESGYAVQAYNPRTNTTADVTGRSNPYAGWEQGVVYGPERSAHAAAHSGERGRVAGVQTSAGAAAVGASDGERSAAAVRAPDGDWYAGGDGNLYRPSAAGWQRYDGARRDDGTGVPGLGRAVGAAGYIPSRPAPQSRYVPSTGLDDGLAGALDSAYAARQRSAMLEQRYRGWGGGAFGGFGGGRYGGFARGGRR